MNYKEFIELISNFDSARADLETTLIENGGEYTIEAEQKDSDLELFATILENEGTDFLGRWYKSTEDKKKALANEKAFIDRCIKANSGRLEYIKSLINGAIARLQARGKIADPKIKGKLGYSFTAYNSITTSADKAIINELYKERIEEAVRALGIPCDITITLGASSSKLEEGAELPAYYIRTETPSVRFYKPKNIKEEDANEEPIQ